MTMTLEIMRDNGLAMIAWSEGKPVDWDYLRNPSGWQRAVHPIWEFDDHKYRPHVEPVKKYRPWTPEEALGRKVWSEESGYGRLVMIVYCNSCALAPVDGDPIITSYESLMDKYYQDRACAIPAGEEVTA